MQTQQPSTIPGGVATLAGRKVARIGFGAMQLDKLSVDEGVKFLAQAIDDGVNHIDTAAFYGNGHVNEIVGRAAGSQSDVVIVTKVGAAPDPGGEFPLKAAQRPEELRAAVESNLQQLSAESLALVNLRRMEIGPGLAATGEQQVSLDDQLAEMVTMRDEGLIQAIGISAVLQETIVAAQPAGIACVQNPYSVLDRRFEDALQWSAAQGVAWVPFFPLGSAFPGFPKVAEDPEVIRIATALGASPGQVGLAWLLNHAQNTLLIPGTSNLEHLQSNLDVGDLTLSADDVSALDAIGAESTTAQIQPPSWPDEAR